MANETKGIILHIKRSLIFSIRLCYRSVCNHPILTILILILILLYRSFPSLFFFLLSSSPVLVCTTLLLGLLLSYGHPNIPQIEEDIDEITPEISPLTVESSTSNLHIKPDESSAIETVIENNREITENEDVNSVNNEERQGLFEEKPAADPATENPVESPRWERINGHDDSSGFESDGNESSSPDPSMDDIIPMLEEIHPLLETESPHPVPLDREDSDVASHESSREEDSPDEGAGNGDEAGEEAAKKDELHESAFTWTADDQKNLMDLGYSELERNRRLESLMARRRSRKNIRFELNQNLTQTGPVQETDELSRFRVQVPPISAPRGNPFDLPYDSEENPIPGSAPSVLLPRRNPFDMPYEEPTENSILSRESWSPKEFMTVSHRDMFFRRHESFNYSGTDFLPEQRFSRFKPYFTQENGDEGASSSSNTIFQRQFSDKSESKLSSAADSDTVSSVTDQELQSPPPLNREKGIQEEEEERERNESEYSDEINSVDVELDNSDDDREIPSAQDFGFYGRSSEESIPKEMNLGPVTPLISTVPDLLSWDDVPAESKLDASSSRDFREQDMIDLSSHSETLISPNTEISAQTRRLQDSNFSIMDLHPIPEEDTTDDKPEKEGESANPSQPVFKTETEQGVKFEMERDSDEEETDKIYPEPISEIDEDLLTELDTVGDFRADGSGAPRQQALESTPFGVHVGDPEQTVYNPRWHVLEASSAKEMDELLGRMRGTDLDAELTEDILEETDSGMLVVKAKSIADIESVFKQESQVTGGENPVVEETESGMLVLQAKSKEDIESVLKQVSQVTETGSSQVIEESDSGMLVVQAKSLEDIESVFKQASEILDASPVAGTRNLDLVEETDSGMLVIRAKSKEDIESVFKQVSEVLDASAVTGTGNPEMVEETDSGMLVLQAKSKEHIESVFKQVSEVLDASPVTGIGSPKMVEETASGMLVLQAKSKEDIESVFKQVSEALDASPVMEIGSPNIVEETDSGMLVVQAKSKEDIESVFKQVSEVLDASLVTGSGNPEIFEETDSGMLVVKAKSKEDIESVFKQVSEVLDASPVTGIESSQIEETDSGMLIVKVKSKDEIESVFKQASEVLGKSVTENGNPRFVEDTESGMVFLEAKSVDDIDSAILKVSENENPQTIDETDSGMLVVKAKSKEDIESVFKQASEVLGKMDKSVGIEDSESGMLILEAKSIEDINSAIKQVKFREMELLESASEE